MTRATAPIAFAALLCIAGGSAVAAERAAVARAIALATLPQGRAPWASAENDAGEVDPDLRLTHLTAQLKRAPDRQQAFEEFLRQQQDPTSPNFHRWLTPDEIGEQFGAPQANIEAVESWLRSQNLQVDGTSNSRVWIKFSGRAADVGAAFASSMRNYLVRGEKRVSISAAPRMPEAISAMVHSVQGLEGVREEPQEHPGPVVTAVPAKDAPQSTSSCSSGTCVHYIWPNDFAAIYNVRTAYSSGLTGAGQSIAIIGRSNVYMQDIEMFQTRAGLKMADPLVIIPPDGIDPGPPQTTPPDDTTTLKDQSEATLDVTRAGSVAPGATIKLVISASPPSGSGLRIASLYVVDTSPVPAQIMSVSFGGCESAGGQSGVAFWDGLFSQAAAEGISAFVSSGDAGIAGCDDHHVAPPTTPQFASPSYFCASGYATCVGGTQFADTASPGSYWAPTNSAGLESALGYIPEGAWNEPTNSSGALQVAATGGGVSSYISTPSWQRAPGVPGLQGRYTPDMSFSAASHDGYARCFAASNATCISDSTGVFHFSASGGTSASAPSMAGVAALLNQKMGSPQGNLNPGLYALANSPAAARVFHDITIATSGVGTCDPATPSLCNNGTPGPNGLTQGLAGYLVGPGYDLATGLGSIDVTNFLANWTAGAAPALSYQGLWWASPANSESGWGINFAHQGDTIFATWFTYDLSGAGNWLVMTAPKVSGSTYAGTLYATTGPPFNSVPFNPASVTAKAEGTGTLTFTDANNGSFSYVIGATSQTKAITREVFGTMPVCATAAAAANLASATNYTDLWWASPANSESGWGINLTHEGTTIFGSWFTYDTSGKAMWLVVTALQTAPNAYSGTLYRTTGPPFNSVPFNPANVSATSVGSATFTFANGNSAQFAYTVGSVSQTKTITREVFAATGTVCQ